LYGLKQEPRAWYSRFTTYLLSLGFVETKADTSLFIFHRGTDTVYLLLYIDDIIMTASSMMLLCHTVSALQWEFVMKDLGPLHHFLDIMVDLQAKLAVDSEAPIQDASQFQSNAGALQYLTFTWPDIAYIV
jgi:hypothetical protein